MVAVRFTGANFAVCFLAIPCLAFFICEFFIYYVVLYSCRWPVLESGDPVALKAFVLADTHLLGPFRGHWFDKLRREWQMHMGFVFGVGFAKPDTVIFLGDLFDEGQWVDAEGHDAYVQRFHSLFPVNSSITIVGNHDVGFHYAMRRENLRRFYSSFNTTSVELIRASGIVFVTLNSMAMEGDGCSMCVEAEHRIRDISKKLLPEERPILLQHFPLYRKSDEECEGEDAAPADQKSIPFRPNLDCISQSSSQLLLKTLQPRAIFSGHTHHGCDYVHDKVTEHSVPSFSWRNRDNPSYLLVTLSKEDYAVEKCFLPRESTVLNIYACASLLVGALVLMRFIIGKKRRKIA